MQTRVIKVKVIGMPSIYSVLFLSLQERKELKKKKKRVIFMSQGLKTPWVIGVDNSPVKVIVFL